MKLTENDLQTFNIIPNVILRLYCFYLNKIIVRFLQPTLIKHNIWHHCQDVWDYDEHEQLHLFIEWARTLKKGSTWHFIASVPLTHSAPTLSVTQQVLLGFSAASFVSASSHESANVCGLQKYQHCPVFKPFHWLRRSSMFGNTNAKIELRLDCKSKINMINWKYAMD